jgi:cysteine desulfuration protein SufE
MEMNKIQDKIIKEFENLSDKQGKFRYFRQLTKIGDDGTDIQPTAMDDSYLVLVHKRKIWLKAWLENDRVFFSAYSSSLIYKGLLGILLKVFSGRSPFEIINCHLYILNEINLYRQLNSEWLDDLMTLLQRIKLLTARLKVCTLT